ncbi:MAG: RNA 2'-phosphotransferase [Candidatus Njordarchaeota archaeon]
MDVSAKYTSLSKLLSLILRHTPEKFNIKMREDGFVDMEELVKNIKKLERFSWVSTSDIMDLAKKDKKGRFEIQQENERLLIRARYGHNKNLRINITYPEAKPGDIKFLYHGTTVDKIESIQKGGIKPMDRQYVHLSTTLSDAIEVAKRRKSIPAIVVVDAEKMITEGLKIYRATNRVYLTKYVSPRFIIKIIKNPTKIL